VNTGPPVASEDSFGWMAAPAAAAARAHPGGRRRQGRRGDGAGGRGSLGRRARRPGGRHALRPRPADCRASSGRGRAPGARRPDARPPRILPRCKGLTPTTSCWCLISGGGSALLALPWRRAHAPRQAGDQPRAAEVRREHHRDELRPEAPFRDQGRPARRRGAPARVVTLTISDVPGDDPAVIASGPTVPDATTCADALAILAKYASPNPPPSLEHLLAGRDETPKPGDPRLAHCETHMIARAADGAEAAAAVARAAGVTPLILGDAIEGESREVALVHAGIARLRATAPRCRRPACCCPAARPPSRCGAGARRTQRRIPARRWPWRSTAHRASMRSPATPTASTAPRKPPARSSRPTPSGARRRRRRRCEGEPREQRRPRLLRGLGDTVVTGPTLTNVNDFRAILIEA
jgi:glycerate 2-kinase